MIYYVKYWNYGKKDEKIVKEWESPTDFLYWLHHKAQENLTKGRFTFYLGVDKKTGGKMIMDIKASNNKALLDSIGGVFETY
jgi:hypothetical protein